MVESKAADKPLKSAVKDIQNNYTQIENIILESAKKYQQSEQKKYQGVLDHLSALKQFLKSETLQRKESQTHFDSTIE